MPTEWISIHDSLPDDEITVLLCNSKTEALWIGFHMGEHFHCNFTNEVVLATHWMHVPQFPEL